MTQSAVAADVKLSTIYPARREDGGFARDSLRAPAEGYDHLELDVLARLRGHVPDGDGGTAFFEPRLGMRVFNGAKGGTHFSGESRWSVPAKRPSHQQNDH